jgi:hypothetical protein
MKLTTTILGSLAICFEAAVLKKPTPTVMKLRGGLGSLDPTQVATYASYLSGVNAGVMALAPEKAAEMYGIENPSALTCQMAEWSGGMMLAIAITSVLALGGMDFTQALAWGSVAPTLQNIQGLLKNTASKLGFGTAAQYVPVITSLVLNAGLFGKAGPFDSALALKVTAGWFLINGIGAYFATEPFMKAWEGPTMSSKELAFGKFFGSVMASTGVFVSSVAFLEKGTLTAVAYAWLAFLITNLDGLFISGTMAKLGADPTGGYVWAAIQAVVAASILA